MTALLVFIFGLFVGSFLNVCIYRIYRKQSIVFPPSRCPDCGKRLGVSELVPVFSWLFQGGRCRGCHERISWRYPVVELATGVTYALLFAYFPGVDFIIQVFFYSILIIVFFIDLEHQIIPNRLVIVLLIYAVAIQVLRPVHSRPEALIGVAVGGGFLLLLAIVSKGGMGGGDVKLMLALGLWFGWQKTLLLMFLAFLGGGLLSIFLLATGIKKRKDGIAFGPFLIVAALITTIWGRDILQWYLGF